MSAIYIVKFIYSALLFPPGIFIIALLLVAWWRRRDRRLAAAVLLSAGVLYLASIGLVSGPLVHSLESRYTPPEWVEGDVIIVLGGGATLDTPNLSGRGHLYGGAANRLLTGLQLYHRLGAPILVSGGQVFADSGSEADIARDILLSVGVPAEKIIVENASLNTSGNARNTAAILAERGFKRPILVTSAFHMERSVRQFAKAGVAVVPFPTDYHHNVASDFHYTALWPSAVAMRELVLGLTEYVGIAAVRWY